MLESINVHPTQTHFAELIDCFGPPLREEELQVLDAMDGSSTTPPHVLLLLVSAALARQLLSTCVLDASVAFRVS